MIADSGGIVIRGPSTSHQGGQELFRREDRATRLRVAADAAARNASKVGGLKSSLAPAETRQSTLGEVQGAAEIWVEVPVMTEEGIASYYYHAISKETTWAKPVGAGIVVIRQQQG